MSKSEWKELPDWQQEADYAFLHGVSREVWAWEFLRRMPQYREDWAKAQEHADEMVYRPARKKAETDSKWMARTVAQGGTPIKERLDLHLARSWGLKRLCDPLKPHSQGVEFNNPNTGFPALIVTTDDFLELVEDEEIETGGAFQKVRDGCAVIAFNITRPIEEQVEAARVILQEWKMQMLKAERISKAESHAGKAEKWKRHLRVLDARRSSPKASLVEIAQNLGGNAPPDRLGKEGGNFVQQANATMKDYKKILMYKGLLPK